MSHFKTIEIADDQFRPKNLTFVTVKSKNLNGRGDIVFYIPETSEKNLPLVILLHGVYGSSWSWSFSGGAHLVAEELIKNEGLKPFIIAMPSDGLTGDGTGYFPHTSANYEKWIIEDIPQAAKEVTPKFSEDSDLFLAGLSMGGFGTLRLGAKHPHLFKGLSAHSAPQSAMRLQDFVEEKFAKIIDLNDPQHAPLYWLKKNKELLPKFRFDCGVDDELIEDNRSLHDELQKACIDHHYEEFPGAHTWSYWNTHLRDTLRFFFA
jgi:putative tributyrin esterase